MNHNEIIDRHLRRHGSLSDSTTFHWKNMLLLLPTSKPTTTSPLGDDAAASLDNPESSVWVLLLNIHMD